MMAKSIALWVGVLVFSVTGSLSERAEARVSKISITPEHRFGELVVKLRKAESVARNAEVFARLIKRMGADSVLSIQPFRTDESAFVLKLAKDEELAGAIAQLKSDPRVEIAEPNLIYHAFDDGIPARGYGDLLPGIPDDPDFAKTWGLSNTGQTSSFLLGDSPGLPGADIHVLPLWKSGIRGSRGIVVAVIDTGIDWEHPDLKTNLFTHPGEIEGDSLDNDGNGFIDDVHGWNFVDNTKNSVDDQGHGSHCAGTIGAQGNNGVGVAGVNWEVSLLPVKFLDSSGSGSLNNAVEAINYARKMKARIMSNSWGGGSYSETLFKAIEEAKNDGILFVAAAGNDGMSNDGSPEYPSGYNVANVVAVAATDNRDRLAGFSNYGHRTVHVAAPGVNIYSTHKNGGYKFSSGTSMATPHVAGISALLLSARPDWTFSEIKERLINTSDLVPGLLGKVASMGRVNASNALEGIVAPGRPDESAWITVDQVVESEHPYKNKEDVVFKVSHPGAKWLRVHFDKVDLEKIYDKLQVLTPGGDIVDELSGIWSDVYSQFVPGEEIQIRLKSDLSVNSFGFKIDRIQYIPADPRH